ncbi:transposase [Candidatus Pacearchaeota archaeon]|nr:transposase [Candidatus Pacearchaeota archaeon]
MKIRKSYKFKLKPSSNQEKVFLQFSGCCRFVWNRALALIKYSLDHKQGYLNYYDLADELRIWKQTPETKFLKDACSQSLQQTLKDLDSAWKRAFKENNGFPKFKKKGVIDSFRYPQHIKISKSRVCLPKIGWVKFQKSREIEGKIKNTTISRRSNHWYVSFQTEIEVDVPDRQLVNPVGIDLGISNFAYLSTGESIKSLNSFKNMQEKLAKAQRKLSRKKKFSNNWKKQNIKVSRIRIKITDCRRDFLQKESSKLSKNHALIVLENLKVSNMSKSAKGTIENPGKNVKAKSGLNRSILDQGWYSFRQMLEYKQLWSGGKLILVNPRNTSRKCSKCGYISKDNRKSQAVFICQSCGHEDHADHNAAKNILEAGQTSLACGNIRPVAA